MNPIPTTHTWWTLDPIFPLSAFRPNHFYPKIPPLSGRLGEIFMKLPRLKATFFHKMNQSCLAGHTLYNYQNLGPSAAFGTLTPGSPVQRPTRPEFDQGVSCVQENRCAKFRGTCLNLTYTFPVNPKCRASYSLWGRAHPSWELVSRVGLYSIDSHVSLQSTRVPDGRTNERTEIFEIAIANWQASSNGRATATIISAANSRLAVNARPFVVYCPLLVNVSSVQ